MKCERCETKDNRAGHGIILHDTLRKLLEHRKTLKTKEQLDRSHSTERFLKVMLNRIVSGNAGHE